MALRMSHNVNPPLPSDPSGHEVVVEGLGGASHLAWLSYFCVQG